jgi:hypothetical protein
MLPVQPDVTYFDAGTEIFPTVFDMTRTQTRVLTELSKLALSELGYVYLNKDAIFGESLRVENSTARDTIIPSKIAVIADNCGHAEQEDGGLELNEDGSYVILNDVEDVNIADEMQSADISFGENIVNRVVVKAHPRFESAADVKLASLAQPLFIASGDTVSGMRMSFVDPGGSGNKINGTDLEDFATMVANGYFKAYQNENRTGTDLTANFTAPVFSPNSDSIDYDLHNAGADAYVTQLDFYGKSITQNNEVDYIADDDASQALYGIVELTIDQPYKDTIDDGAQLAIIIKDNDKTPRRNYNSATYLANNSWQCMAAFLGLDIGFMFAVIDNPNGYADNCYVQKIKFKITQGKLIYYTLYFKPFLTLTDTYWELGIAGHDELGDTTFVAFDS